MIGTSRKQKEDKIQTCKGKFTIHGRENGSLECKNSKIKNNKNKRRKKIWYVRISMYHKIK